MSCSLRPALAARGEPQGRSRPKAWETADRPPGSRSLASKTLVASLSGGDAARVMAELRVDILQHVAGRLDDQRRVLLGEAAFQVGSARFDVEPPLELRYGLLDVGQGTVVEVELVVCAVGLDRLVLRVDLLDLRE